MSDPVLPRPWDSPGKNTGVGCHFLLQCMKVKSESEVAQSCPTLSDPMDCSHQAPPSMGFSRQEYWSWVPLPSPYLGSKEPEKKFGMIRMARIREKTSFKAKKPQIKQYKNIPLNFLQILDRLLSCAKFGGKTPWSQRRTTA